MIINWVWTSSMDNKGQIRENYLPFEIEEPYLVKVAAQEQAFIICLNIKESFSTTKFIAFLDKIVKSHVGEQQSEKWPFFSGKVLLFLHKGNEFFPSIPTKEYPYIKTRIFSGEYHPLTLAETGLLGGSRQFNQDAVEGGKIREEVFARHWEYYWLELDQVETRMYRFRNDILTDTLFSHQPSLQIQERAHAFLYGIGADCSPASSLVSEYRFEADEISNYAKFKSLDLQELVPPSFVSALLSIKEGEPYRATHINIISKFLQNA